jgi:hypothetical protein
MEITTINTCSDRSAILRESLTYANLKLKISTKPRPRNETFSKDDYFISVFTFQSMPDSFNKATLDNNI